MRGIEIRNDVNNNPFYEIAFYRIELNKSI